MKSVTEYVDVYRERAARFSNEEEVRIGTNELLKELIEDFGIDHLEESHETTSIHGGRADSIYSDVIIEYKFDEDGMFRTARGRSEALFGRDASDRGLQHYLINFTLDEFSNHAIDDELFCRRLINKVGVGFDGQTMIFARFVEAEEAADIFDRRKTKALPKTLSSRQHLRFIYEHVEDLDLAFKKLILLLRSTSRYCLSTKTLTKEFGPRSPLCQKTIGYLYAKLESELTANTRISTLYAEWLRIFGVIYGKQETDFTAFRASLAKMYGLSPKLDPQKTLFIIQTYYNIVLKLLIFNLLQSLTDPMQKSRRITTRRDILELFSGRMYTKLQIKNFFEINYFEWFLFASDLDKTYINDIEIELDNFETTTSVIKGEVVEDVLRDVYANLIPQDLRHLMGEYYTCGWLVDFTLDKVGYTGQKELSVLDPTCGSGAFITHAIKRLQQSEKELGNDEIIKIATRNIVGYDINPIAVISAKTNYLLALGDISAYKEAISVPVYMCDSILVPTVYAKQKTGKAYNQVKTKAGKFVLPVMQDRTESDLFLDKVNACADKGYSFTEFAELVHREGEISAAYLEDPCVETFYRQILELNGEGGNGFWCNILKNTFAPLFTQKFDLVVGNPPWIGWKSMSDTYRKRTLDIWLSYGIFEKSAYDKITSHDDFAMAVVYVSMDHYVKEQGKAAFVLPQTFVKSLKGGEGFRKFEITRDGASIPFAVNEVYDMDKIKPFRRFATNKASVMIFEKNKPMVYPMDRYFLCLPKTSKIIVDYYDGYAEAMDKMVMIQQAAKPIKNDDPRSPWLTMDKCEMDILDRFRGASAYKGRKGIEPCGAKGTYLVNVKENRDNLVLIENLLERARLQEAKDLGVHPGWVEQELVYPMVGGRNISKWGINSHLYMLVPHDATGESVYRGMEEGRMRVEYPHTYEWLFYFHDFLLETRKRSAKFFDEAQFPWYRLDNVGSYTFQKYHVVWKEQSKSMTACVIGSMDDPYLGQKVVVTDSKVLSCATDDEAEAHYICAVINSPIITKIIDGYTIDTQRGIDILSNIAIPKYDAAIEEHAALAEKSRQAHQAFIAGDADSIKRLEKEIDELVHRLFA